MYIPVTTHSKLQPGLSLFYFLFFFLYLSLFLSFLRMKQSPPLFLKRKYRYMYRYSNIWEHIRVRMCESESVARGRERWIEKERELLCWQCCFNVIPWDRIFVFPISFFLIPFSPLSLILTLFLFVYKHVDMWYPLSKIFQKQKNTPSLSLSHAPFLSPRIWTGNAWCKYRFPWYLSHKEFRLANSVSLSHKKFDWPTQSVTQEILIDQKSLSHRKFCFDQLISLSRGKSFTRYSRVGRIPP